MDLKIKDVAELLKVSEKTVYRWIKEKSIPVYHINHQYRFDRAEINDWIVKTHITTDGVKDTLTAMPPGKTSAGTRGVGIKELLLKGGIYYKIEGRDMEACIRNSLQLISLPRDISREQAAERILERERLMNTCVGGGVAFPHARNPLLSRFENESVALCMVDDPLDYHALDGMPIHSLFFILTAGLQRHLECMTRLTHFCKDPAFLRLLEQRAPRGEILAWIAEQEKNWL